ncbi:MAG: AAA family ATPase [Armatimonadetes bacterium]|nr:AAA family ATPase [Armatimonadota bacterium]
MPQEHHCPACGRAIAPDDRFCGRCGTAVADKPASAPRAARASLGEVFAHLRSGEQRPATILMTDVSGFSSLAEGVEPEWLYHLINQVFEELVDCLVAHGAHIDNYVGDEIVALFGVPFAQEKSAVRAILAALSMRERLDRLNRAGRFGNVPLGIHTGINAGPVMVGPVGHREHADYTVIGDTVNVAKRLESEAPVGEVYVSRAVRDAAATEIDFESVGSVSLRGRREPVEVFRVLGARRRSKASLSSEASPARATVPRERELAELSRLSEEASSGNVRVACVTGPPGIGKSALVAHWLQSNALSDFRILSAFCHACGQQFPLLPLADILSQVTGLRVENWPPQVVGDFGAGLAALGLAESHRRSLCGALSHFSVRPHQYEASDAQGLGESLAALIGRITASGPVCLVLEDIHWCDEGTQQVLVEALASYSRWPLLVLLTARPPLPDWMMAALPVTLVDVRPLARRAMEQLVASWASPQILPATTVRAICDRADGHPYFARELVRALRERATPSAGSDGGLPDTLQELFLSRLDSLPLPLRQTVQAASVVGEPFSASLLASCLEGDVPVSDGILWQAAQAGLLRPGSGAGQYVFGPRLLFDAAYATIPPSRRRDLHARIATHLAGQLSTMGASAVHAAAHHAYLGYGDERALDLLMRSAEQYRAQYANRHAIQAAGRALEIIVSLPDPATRLVQRLEALLLLAQSHQVVGELGAAEGALAEAEVLAEDCTDCEINGRIALASATLQWMQGDLSKASAGFARAHQMWEALGNATRAAQALVGGGLCAGQSGDREGALALFERAAADPRVEPWVHAAAVNNAGIMLLEDGRYEEAEPYLSAGLDANERDDDRRGRAQSKTSLGELNYRRGRLDVARELLEQAVAEAGEIEDASCLPLATAYLARVLSASGGASVARSLLAAIARDVEVLQPDVEAPLRVAELEATLPCAVVAADQAARAQARGLRALSNWPACPGQVSAVCQNAYVEILCVGVEGALLSGHRTTGPWFDRLRDHADSAVDVHLRRYAEWLLSLADQGQEVPPFADQPQSDSVSATDPGTIFNVRARRLREALGR